MQVHGVSVEKAYAGQRVAVNLAGLKKTEIERGDAVARPGSVRVSRMLDVKLLNLKNSQRVITNDMQVHLYHGAAVMLAKVVLLDRDALNPGESGYAQLRMAEPIASKNGDRFVIRFYSPLETIGGGVILDDAPARHKRGVPSVIEALKVKESGSVGDRLTQTVAEFSTLLPTAEKLAAKLGMEAESLRTELRELMDGGRVAEPLEGRYIAASALDGVSASCRSILADYHRQNPLHAGMKAAELRQKLFKGAEQAAADALLNALCREGAIKRAGERYALFEFEIHYTKKQSAIREKLLGYYLKAGIEPAATDEVAATFAQNERADYKQVLDSVLSGGELVMLAPEVCYSRDAYARACEAARAHFQQNETLTLAELRDILGTSRKYALAILEYFDRNGITKKDGDLRRLNRGF